MTIIWCIIPEIWSAIDRIFCHSGPILALLPPMDPENQNFEKMKEKKNAWRYYHLTHVYHKWHMVPQIWSVMDRIFDIFGPFFPLLPPPPLPPPLTIPKNQNLKNEKKSWKYYHFLYVYHKWQPYNVLEIWNVTHRIFCHFGSFFCPFSPQQPKKKKFLKNWKKHLETSSFYTSVPKTIIMIICYTVLEIWHVTDVIIFHIGLFFALLPPKSPKNQNL